MIPKFTDAGVTWAVLTVMVGFLLCIAGYRLLRFSACAIAFITGATLIVDQVLIVPFLIAAALFYWPLYLLFGCLFGFFGSSSTSASVLVISFCGGANFVQLCLALLEFHGSLGLSFVITVVSSVICAIVAVKFETKPALVASTSFLGALTMASGVGYLMRAALTSGTPSETPFKEIASWANFMGCLLWGPNEFFKGETQMQITSWAVFAILMVLVACGGLLQWKLTGRGNHHETSSPESLPSEETQQHGGNNGESVNAAMALRYASLQSPQEVKRSVYQQTRDEDKEYYYVRALRKSTQLNAAPPFGSALLVQKVMFIDSWLAWVGSTLFLIVVGYEAIACLIRNPRLLEAVLMSGATAAIGAYVANWVLNSPFVQAATSSQLGSWAVLFAILVFRVVSRLLRDLYVERQENGTNNDNQQQAATESEPLLTNMVTDDSIGTGAKPTAEKSDTGH